jgi:two-component system phosphate regulon sensor histidine kinase PhoR
MKEKKLKIIVTLMSLALIGLIAIQVYWIKHTLAIEELRFDANVSSALSEFVNRIDKEETASVLIQRVLPKGERIFIIDSIGNNKIRPFTIWTESRNEIYKESLTEGNSFNIEYEETIIDGDMEAILRVDSEGNIDTIKSKGSINFTRSKLDSFLVTKKELVSDVVDELIEIKASRTERNEFNREYFDTLLSKEFLDKGIEAEFNFGILDNESNVFLTDSDADTSEIKSAKYRVRINKNDLFNDASYLTVHFPRKNSYIVSSVSSVLGISLFLILIIIGVFYKTVQMLIRQKKLTEIKNDLINNITHEFKTPISTISLACEALNEPLLIENPSSLPRYTGMIKDENQRLSHLVENLLSTAAIEKGEYKLNKTEADVHKIINEIIENHRLKVELKNGEITSSLNAANSKLKVDKFHFSNAINNLLDNAVKYSTDHPRITVSSWEDDGNLLISIKDSGIGISKTDQKKIFDTFYRVPKGNIHDVKGNGIGLSYTRKMIEAHNGTISVTSKLNEGSIFTIKLPYE